MAKVEVLTLSSVLGLLNADGAYSIAYSFLFGMSVWVSFFGGVIAFKTLPRHQFGTLQHKTFPIYFSLSMALSASLLAKWTFSHPDVLTHITRPNVADVAQAYTLASVFLAHASNYFILGPMTGQTMLQRQRLEKEEGKVYSDPGVSAEMKGLNARFGALHGISSLVNLGSVIALGFHGLWIGNAGASGY